MITSHLSRRLVVGGFAAAGAVACSGRSSSAPPVEAAGFVNEWPDPQFCVQDASGLAPAIDDALDGAVPPIRVDGYSTGALEVSVRVSGTSALAVGDLVRFDGDADPALRATIVRVRGVTPGGFECRLEYGSGAPMASRACTAQVVQHGDDSGGGNGDVTGNVAKWGGGGRTRPRVWISERRAHTGRLRSCRRVLVVRKVTSEPEFVYWQAPGSQVASLAGGGRAVGLAAVVASGTGATARARVFDGQTEILGPSTARGPERTWLSAQATLSPRATVAQLGVTLEGPPGSTFVLGEFTHCPSAAPLPDGAFSTPHAQLVRFLASVSPWAGASLTMPQNGFVMDVQQQSQGALNAGVSMVHGLVEGQCQTPAAVLAFATRKAAPALYDPILHQEITGADSDSRYYAFAGGVFNLTDDPPSMYVYGSPGAAWRHLSFDLHAATLFAGP